MQVKRLCLLITVLIAIHSLSANAIEKTQPVSIDGVQLIRSGDKVQMVMDVMFDREQVGYNDILLVEPVISSVEKDIRPASVGIYGRDPFYYIARMGKASLQEPQGIRLRAKDAPQPYHYAVTLGYEQCMQRSVVILHVRASHDCDGQIELLTDTVFALKPTIVTTPDKVESISGSLARTAYIDFVVNKTDIRPDYHDNERELSAIAANIDSIRSMPSARIVAITLKGFASPEGPFQGNARLARGRTESIRQYIMDRFGIDPAIIRADYEPEDWEGLRRAVDNSTLPHRLPILDIIATSMDPDARLALIRERYPDDYRFILDNVMPFLRHTDYKIDYETLVFNTIKDRNDTIWNMPEGRHHEATDYTIKRFYPDLALKTNLLFDVAAALNFEIEVPFGRDYRWSIMAEDWFPWYVWHHNSRAYEIWNIGVELRRWFGRCPGRRPALSGHFIGAYVTSGKYDVEWGSVGDQGEFVSAGATYGYSWPLARHWNLEASISAGALWGPRRHYNGEFQDTHLIWKYTGNLFYVGPTKLKLSLVWMLQLPFRKKPAPLNSRPAPMPRKRPAPLPPTKGGAHE